MIYLVTRFILDAISSLATISAGPNFYQKSIENQNSSMINFVEKNKDTEKITYGIFAPWMMYKKEFLEILGGHDPIMHSCREDSDLFNRMLLAEFNFLESVFLIFIFGKILKFKAK